MPTVAVIGKTLLQENELLRQLRGFARVSSIEDTALDESLQNRPCATVILFELSGEGAGAIEQLKRLRVRCPQSHVIIVEGANSSNHVIETFQMGGDDYFRYPVDVGLLVERVAALIRMTSRLI